MLFMMAVALTGQTMAAPINDDEQPEQFMQEEIVPVTVTYLDNVYSNGGWDANWFITVQGGMSAFLGKPVGHGDFFDRTKPLLNISAGKWITPTVAVRASFQGFQLIDAFMESRKYQNLHADLMYNITNAMREDYEMLNKWDLIPYIGIGLVHNSYNGAKPFGMTLGIAGRYRLTDRLHLTGEISNTFTSKAFDGWGENKIFGDNLAQASIGLTYTIGKNGWKRVVDPKPYMFQNDQLMSQLENANSKIHKLNVQKAKDAASLAEMRKILEIEGFLDKYDLSIPEGEVKKYPKNNYSGLNSLRARLRGKNWNEDDGIHPRLAQTDKVYEPAAWNAADTTKLDPRAEREGSDHQRPRDSQRHQTLWPLSKGGRCRRLADRFSIYQRETVTETCTVYRRPAEETRSTGRPHGTAIPWRYQLLHTDARQQKHVHIAIL